MDGYSVDGLVPWQRLSAPVRNFRNASRGDFHSPAGLNEWGMQWRQKIFRNDFTFANWIYTLDCAIGSEHFWHIFKKNFWAHQGLNPTLLQGTYRKRWWFNVRKSKRSPRQLPGKWFLGCFTVLSLKIFSYFQSKDPSRPWIRKIRKFEELKELIHFFPVTW